MERVMWTEPILSFIPVTQFWTAHTSNDGLPLHEALSGILSSISLSSWIFFLIPQLLENRRNQSGEAVSLSFMFIRLVGDTCNLLGALLAHIIPGMIAVAADYVISDIVLISQVLYYGIKNRQREGKSTVAATIDSFRGNLQPADVKKSGRMSRHGAFTDITGEHSPLLRHRTSRVNSHNLNVQDYRHTSPNVIEGLTDFLDEQSPQSTARIWFSNLAFVVLVCAVGLIGWALAYHCGVLSVKLDDSAVSDNKDDEITAKVAQALGYTSAVLSLCSRIPQILKNWRHRSCKGLSILFFVLSLIGNITNGASIILHSTQRDYLLKNIPWLVGSIGTIGQDVVLLLQCYWYRQLDT